MRSDSEITRLIEQGEEVVAEARSEDSSAARAFVETVQRLRSLDLPPRMYVRAIEIVQACGELAVAFTEEWAESGKTDPAMAIIFEELARLARTPGE